jgi:hypothetical protein
VLLAKVYSPKTTRPLTGNEPQVDYFVECRGLFLLMERVISRCPLFDESFAVHSSRSSNNGVNMAVDRPRDSLNFNLERERTPRGTEWTQ